MVFLKKILEQYSEHKSSTKESSFLCEGVAKGVTQHIFLNINITPCIVHHIYIVNIVASKVMS